jgi:hypothetical protein
MALFWLVLLIVTLVLLCSSPSEEADHLDPHQTIRAIGSQARREAEDLSEEFLRRAIDILNQKRR